MLNLQQTIAIIFNKINFIFYIFYVKISIFVILILNHEKLLFMKKISSFLSILILSINIINASTGWYEDYIKLNVNSTGEVYYWIGGNPSFGTQLQGASLGTVSSLEITGADMKYWSDSQDRTGGSFFYKVTDTNNNVTYIPATEVIWDQTYLEGNNYQGLKTININLRATVPGGTTCRLEVWAKSWGNNQGDSWLTNGGANYVATFTTTPLYWGGTGIWTDAGWSTSDGGPYTTNWVSGSAIVFNIPNSTITANTTNFSNILAYENVTVTAGGTLGTNGSVATITVANGKVFNMESQSLSSSNGTGFIKNGEGTWNIGAQINEYNGGFTLNSGTVIVSGQNSFGGINSLLTINGGTIQISSSPKFQNNVILGNDFILSGTGTGTANFLGNVDLGANTRKITNNTTGATRIFSGIILGQSGVGITFDGTGSGVITFSGNNTYDGLTTINGSTLKLNALGGALKTGNAVSIGGGTLEIAQSQTIGDLTMTSGTLKIDVGQTLTITGNYNVTGGTINNLGTIILQGTSSQSFPENATINNGTVGKMTNLTINNNQGVFLDNSFSLDALTVNPAAQLILNSDKSISATTFTILSDNTGTGTFINNGTLTSSTTTVNQYLTYRSWYMSSPVQETVAPAVSTSGWLNKIESYNESNKSWPESTTMTAPTGYLVVPVIQAETTSPTTISFSGTLNNGDIPVTLSKTGTNGFNLIGNPYPSYIDWTKVYSENASSANMPTSTMWYRTKVSGSWDFATVNGASGEVSPATISKLIPPMQAFWVRTSTNGSTLTFKNDMRVQETLTNLLKTRSIVAPERQIVRLQLSDGTNTDETVIYTNTNASDGFDVYDSPMMTAESVVTPQIYTTVENEQLVLNGMSTLPTDTEIPLEFVPGSSTSFSIKANEVNNLPSDINLILKDNATGTETDLTDGTTAYDFIPVSTSTNRFSIIFRTAGTTTATQNLKDNKNIQIYTDLNNRIIVNTNGKQNGIYSVEIYNTAGQKLAGVQSTNSVTTLSTSLSQGVYLVKVNVNGNSTIQKVVIH